MDKIRIIEVKESVFSDNNKDADKLRGELKEQKTFLLNLMSSPGSGKTTFLKGIASRLKDKIKMGVMEADIDSDVDAAAMAECDIKTIQLHTVGMCHLDASMTRQGLEEFGTKGLDLVVLENVGNLVCPAEFDTGSVKNAVILSVPEGHDKPLKYPLMFQVAHALIIEPALRMNRRTMPGCTAAFAHEPPRVIPRNHPLALGLFVPAFGLLDDLAVRDFEPLDVFPHP